MRKFTLLTLFLFMCVFIRATTCVDFITRYVPNKPIGNSTPKTPMRPPVVYIEDNTLTFVADHPEYVLFIRDEEGDVVYTTVVSSSVTQVVLPSTLSGEYQIELVMGSWLFVGEITV